MAIQSTSSSSFAVTTSIEVPASANFIGSIEDALVFQSLVLNSTTDRLRESILRSLAPTSASIEQLEVLSSLLARLATFTQTNQVPVTYGALQSADKTTVSLRALFAQDGPNLGDSLEKSQAVLSELATSGVTLAAPKQTPVMTESFVAVGGKVDFSKPPLAASVDWRTDQEVAPIDPGSVPGSLPGTLVKVIESRDSAGKLISVTRHTIFVDYANLRPQKADLDKEFSGYIEKIRLTLDDLVLRLAETLKTESTLNQRQDKESVQIKDDQKFFFEKEQEKVASLFEARRLFRIFYLEVNNLKVQLDQKIDSNNRLNSKNDQTDTVIDFKTGKQNLFLSESLAKFEPSPPMKSALSDNAGLLNSQDKISSIKVKDEISSTKIKDEISSLKSLFDLLSKEARSISDSVPDNP